MKLEPPGPASRRHNPIGWARAASDNMLWREVETVTRELAALLAELARRRSADQDRR